MHPNPAFRTKLNPADERLMLEALLREIGFGMVFFTTPDGPRVAHAALYCAGDGAVQFHLANGNAITKHLADQNALIVVNGPDSYISPDWYAQEEQVPTWDYVSVELEGPVRKMERDRLIALLDDISRENEERLAPKKPWTRDKMDAVKFDKMLGAITGFEMEVKAWRPTLKLSQTKPLEVRERVADALEAQGKRALAHMMREWGG
jgi:transcriptional regulator